MSKNNKILIALLSSALTLIAIFLPSTTAIAKTWPDAESLELIAANCSAGADQFQQITQLQQQIAAAGNVSEARLMALAPTDDAIDALKNARTIMPFSDDLKLAETRLSDARSRIQAAPTQAEIADEFSGMMLAGLDNDSAAHVNVGKVGCDYSTGELIAIVVGLILGIIPGLILLIVLC